MSAPLPDICRRTQDAIMSAPLDLPPELESHAARCQACREARVHWLAMEEADLPLVPADYFDRLPDRILRKLPGRPVRRLRTQPLLWSVAAGLAIAAGIGGYWAGRATPQAPTAAALPETEVLDTLPETPFADAEDPLTQLGSLSPQEAESLARKLAAQRSKPSRPTGSKP